MSFQLFINVSCTINPKVITQGDCMAESKIGALLGLKSMTSLVLSIVYQFGTEVAPTI